jgi:hypothetical protein
LSVGLRRARTSPMKSSSAWWTSEPLVAWGDLQLVLGVLDLVHAEDVAQEIGEGADAQFPAWWPRWSGPPATATVSPARLPSKRVKRSLRRAATTSAPPQRRRRRAAARTAENRVDPCTMRSATGAPARWRGTPCAGGRRRRRPRAEPGLLGAQELVDHHVLPAMALAICRIQREGTRSMLRRRSPRGTHSTWWMRRPARPGAGGAGARRCWERRAARRRWPRVRGRAGASRRGSVTGTALRPVRAPRRGRDRGRPPC